MMMINMKLEMTISLIKEPEITKERKNERKGELNFLLTLPTVEIVLLRYILRVPLRAIYRAITKSNRAIYRAIYRTITEIIFTSQKA